MAVALLATVVLGVITIQGSAITFNEFDRKVSQATWLAKSAMAKIEWGSKFYDFKELKINVKDESFDPILCPTEASADCNFKYSAEIKEWKFDILSLLTGGFGAGSKEGSKDEDSENKSGSNPIMDQIKEQIKGIFGEEILRVATVEVVWAEGAKQNSVRLTMLLTNQLPLDQFIENLPAPKEAEEKDEGKAGQQGANQKQAGQDENRKGQAIPTPLPNGGEGNEDLNER